MCRITTYCIHDGGKNFFGNPIEAAEENYLPEQIFNIFERKIIRRIYGPKYENGELKSWTNRELEEMSKG